MILLSFGVSNAKSFRFATAITVSPGLPKGTHLEQLLLEVSIYLHCHTSKNKSLFVSLLHVTKELRRGTYSKQLDLGTHPQTVK